MIDLPIPSHWISDCIPFGKHSVRTNIYVEERMMKIKMNLYREPNKCKTLNAEARYVGPYEIGEKLPHGIAFSVSPREVTLTAKSREVVDNYNRRAYCGFEPGTWKLNQPRDVAGFYCEPIRMPMIGLSTYDLFRVELEPRLQRRILRLGEIPFDYSALLPEQRPQEVSRFKYFQQVDSL